MAHIVLWGVSVHFIFGIFVEGLDDCVLFINFILDQSDDWLILWR